MLQSLFSPALQPLFSALGELQTRWIATLNGLSQYPTFPVINLTPSDVLTVEFIADTALAMNDYILSGVTVDVATDVVLLTNPVGLINFGSGNYATVKLDGNKISSLSVVWPSDGLKHVITYQPANNQRFVNFGTRFSISNFLKVSLLSIKVNDGSVFNYPFDDSFVSDPIIKNEAAVLGAEQVTNGEFESDTAWQKGTGWSIDNGLASLDGSGSSDLRQNGVLTVDETTLVMINVVESVSGTLRLLDGASGIFADITAVGLYKLPLTANGTDIRITSSSGGWVGSVSLISSRQADGYGIIANSTAAMWSKVKI